MAQAQDVGAADSQAGRGSTNSGPVPRDVTAGVRRAGPVRGARWRPPSVDRPARTAVRDLPHPLRRTAQVDRRAGRDRLRHPQLRVGAGPADGQAGGLRPLPVDDVLRRPPRLLLQHRRLRPLPGRRPGPARQRLRRRHLAARPAAHGRRAGDPLQGHGRCRLRLHRRPHRRRQLHRPARRRHRAAPRRRPHRRHGPYRRERRRQLPCGRRRRQLRESPRSQTRQPRTPPTPRPPSPAPRRCRRNPHSDPRHPHGHLGDHRHLRAARMDERHGRAGGADAGPAGRRHARGHPGHPRTRT